MSTDVRRRYVDGPYGQVHLYEAGARGAGKRPMVCFHQSPLSGRTFDAFMRELGGERYMVAPDTPGFGHADAPPKALSIEEYATAHSAVIDAMDLGEMDVIGVHTGARIAVEFTRLHRDQVKHVVLVGVGVYTEEERAKQRAWTGASSQPTENSDGSHLVRLWNNWAQFRGPGVTDAMIERYVSDSLRNRGNVANAMNAVFSHDMAAALGDLEQPVLVFNVRDDVYGPTARSAEVMKNGRVVDLSPSGLWPLETRTEEIAEMVRAHCGG
ncbi:MAG: alpha/beta hydrolase [Proteobacteria bacterium]|nr:alpha/beta hydrolase [Pseudomonadota bacterium]MDA1059899.1 alpha/beta hydrolase [Pseudomonadota bacterium]